MNVRPIEERDLEAVRELRNRERRWFFDDHEITPDEQRDWFRSLGERPIRFYVIEEDGRVVGTVSVTETPEGRELGNYIVHPDYRGRGLGHTAVDEVTSEPGLYYALVKHENEHVLRRSLSFDWKPVHVRIEKRVS